MDVTKKTLQSRKIYGWGLKMKELRAMRKILSHYIRGGTENKTTQRSRAPSLPSYTKIVGRDSSVGVTTRYGLDDPGIESLPGQGSPHPS